MRATFLGKDPQSGKTGSPMLFASDRSDRKTYFAQGWIVTDPQALADIGPIPDGEAVVEVPEEVLSLFLKAREADR